MFNLSCRLPFCDQSLFSSCIFHPLATSVSDIGFPSLFGTESSWLYTSTKLPVNISFQTLYLRFSGINIIPLVMNLGPMELCWITVLRIFLWLYRISSKEYRITYEVCILTTGSIRRLRTNLTREKFNICKMSREIIFSVWSHVQLVS